MPGLNIKLSDIEYEYRVIKSHIRNKNKVFFFEKNYYANLMFIYNNINNWEFSKYNIFKIYEPKSRIIMSENIFDKIVNHLICRKVLLPLDKYLIDSNCATRERKGTKYARRLLDKYINKLKVKDFYILKFDIKKYFYNINHDLLLKSLNKYLNTNQLSSIKKILDTTNLPYINERLITLSECNLYKFGYGLPIGNYTSQFLAIFYLNEMDHFIKEQLNCKYYIRYMDDGIILSPSKENLRIVLDTLKVIVNKLDLEFNNKTKIYKSTEGFEFIGFRYKVINNRISRRVKNNSRRRIRKSINKNNYANYNNYFKYER